MKSLIRVLVLCGLIAIPAALEAGNISNGAKTCPASGRIALSATSIKASWVSIQAPSTNSGSVYVGGSTVVVTTSANGLAANGAFFMPPLANVAPYELSQIYIACTNSGDLVTFTYFQ